MDAERTVHNGRYRSTTLNRVTIQYPFPIAIVRLTFRGKFPHGTMRNSTMHSNETRLMTSVFTQKGFHPYLSFQDSDASSRRVGSDEGLHVFHAVDRELAGIIPDETLRAPTRPLMVAGGYRPQNQVDLNRMTEERLAKAPLKGVTREQIPNAGFARNPMTVEIEPLLM